MRFDRDIYIAGTGTYLPPTVRVQSAIEAGLVAESHRDLGYETVAVAEDISAADMAVAAAQAAALAGAGALAAWVGIPVAFACCAALLIVGCARWIMPRCVRIL